MRPYILRGDKTSHGGTVISGASVTTIDGRAMVRVGDKATCPKKGCPDIVTVISGDPTFVVEGAPVAGHGDRVSCGAVLLASQGCAGFEESSSSSYSYDTPSNSNAATNLQEIHEEELYNENIKIVDDNGKLESGLPFYIEDSYNHKVLSGVTDENGNIPTVNSGRKEESYKVYLGDEALVKIQRGF